VEKKKYNLCIKVLRRFSKEGLLSKLVLIGSWCLYFYEDFFAGLRYTPSIRTRDIDILVPIPSKIKKEVDIPKLLEDMGFFVDFVGSKGYMRLNHPELIVEFLVPERGKGSNKPYDLPALKMNAQPLRYLDLLLKNTIKVKYNKMVLNVPHPAAFALHKMIIYKRRGKKDKADKDKQQALMLFDYLVKKKDVRKLRQIFNFMHKKWQKTVLDNLKDIERQDIIDILSSK
jgi:hypothetical protein